MDRATAGDLRERRKPLYCNAMASVPALAGMRVSLLGAGRVGSSLAYWAVGHGARLTAVASASPAGAARLAAELGGAACRPPDLRSADSDLLLVAVPDLALDAAATDLGSRPQAGVALHCAGSRDSSALAALRVRGSAVGAFHPLMAFPAVRRKAADAAGLVFGVDGDPAALELAARLAAAWGSKVVLVPPAARLLYHYAATLAAGGVLTLIALAEEIAGRVDLPAEVGEGYRRLAESALGAARGGSAAAAITGPVARGDARLVGAQLDAAARSTPESAGFEVRLGLETLRQIARERALTQPQLELRDSLLSRLLG